MTFKILSLDGGGIRGVLSATILQEVERVLEAKGQSLNDYFDLVAGTSTGSLLAAGIALGMKSTELVELYLTEGEKIFPKKIREAREWRYVSQVLGKSYVLYPHEDTNKKGEKIGLSTVLKKKFGDREIQSITDPILLVLAYDTLNRNTTWFCSNNSPTSPLWYDNLPIWKICTASASAPTLFPPYDLPVWGDENQIYPHIDGGVSANNPSLAAVAHAMLTAKVQLEDIVVLSIGTGQTTEPFTYDEIKGWGLLNWIKNLPNIFLNPSAEISNATCSQILNLGSKIMDRHVRLDFQLNSYLMDKENNEKVRKIRMEPDLNWWKKLPPNLTRQRKAPINTFLNKQICEDIDNPDACGELIEAAKAYIKQGKVYLNGKYLTVEESIDYFVNLNEENE